MQFATPMAAVLGVLLSAYPPVAYGLALAREQKILKRLRGTPLPPSAYLVGRVGGAARPYLRFSKGDSRTSTGTSASPAAAKPIAARAAGFSARSSRPARPNGSWNVRGT